MNTAAIKKIELMHKIAKLSEQNISEVNNCIQKILSQAESEILKPVNLKGIWKDKGFEKLKDLESEININKNEIEKSILKKTF